jgi:GGDEF domain-containing protein
MWAYLLSMASFIPVPHKEIERQTGELAHKVFDAVRRSERSRQDHEAERNEVIVELSLLRNQLLHNVRTGLPNRQFFITRLERVLNTGSPMTVYHPEIDGLYTISDRLEPRAAAEMPPVVADRLASVMATEQATVACFEPGRRT